jgi:uncharacterized protein YdhG (YjbR/CyaY superfamily)
MKETPKDINAYIANVPENVREKLEQIRALIKKTAPNAEEMISYGIPAFKLHGKRLAYFAAFKKHIGFYPPPPKVLKKEVISYTGPKGNLQFPFDRPIPFHLIKKIVALKIKEISVSGKKTK